MEQINDGTEGKSTGRVSPEQIRAAIAVIGVGPTSVPADTDVNESDPRLMTHAEREAKVRAAAESKGLDFRQELFRSRAPKGSASDNSLGL
jgi:hypothetical protein